MKFHSFCPRCSSELTTEHHSTGVAICACGWADDSPTEVAIKKTEKTSIQAMVAFSVLVAVGFGHLQSWGQYATSIPFTKLAQMTTGLSAQGYRDLAKACIELNKWSCAEEAYIELTTVAGDIQGFAELGSLRNRLKQPEGALQAYEAYEKKGGKDAFSLVQYGKLLEAARRDDDAMKMFEKSIANSGEALPVQATTGIVQLLMKQGRYEEAYMRVIAFHESAQNASGYMNTELAQLQQQLGSVAARKIEKRVSKEG
jgi:tetratricopeptide (TPR) repeat protein